MRSSYRFSESAVIRAPAERIFAILADYREGHPSILPRPPFESLEVEQGGVGAGTVVRCRIRLLGATREFRAAITEPEPGRVLAETDLATGAVTTFTVVPTDGGNHSEVTIGTELPLRKGLAGIVERLLVPRQLRPVYLRQLRLLAQVAEAPRV